MGGGMHGSGWLLNRVYKIECPFVNEYVYKAVGELITENRRGSPVDNRSSDDQFHHLFKKMKKKKKITHDT